MASKTTRVVALVCAILFFVTSAATTAMVIYQMTQENKAKNSETADANTNQQSQGDKLEGTKLKDFTPVDKVTELKVIDVKVGTGDEVKAGATVTAHYTGAIAKDGTIFQSSHDQPGDQPVQFGLDQVIKGWTEGVPGMKVGGTRRLIIPAEKAYGAQSPSPNIPPNSDLVFDIELTAVQNN